ncbi:DUF3833 family protein [Bosea sp. ANAM02]|uniref:DUF3833 family protein n=1 Tax=Bosea sp. ANAM02 TaxID=2020412 RepID=UPI00140ECFE3|nr:DUF3833 family protein [Bosea sp. ANAM02]BCB18605.1 hypothetical protein OCUBac02_14990 [Bosea sp. ANAM02]
MKADDFSGMLPAFQLRDFFTGRMARWAMLEGPLGGLKRRVPLTAAGRELPDGAFAFSETWTFDEGQVDELRWLIKLVGGGKFEGSDPSLDGPAKGCASGCAFNCVYIRNVPGREGETTKLNFDDWLR